MRRNEPETFATNLHCVTDLLKMLTILVAKQGGEVYITQELVQDFADYNLFLESSFDTSTLRLTTRKTRGLHL